MLCCEWLQAGTARKLWVFAFTAPLLSASTHASVVAVPVAMTYTPVSLGVGGIDAEIGL